MDVKVTQPDTNPKLEPHHIYLRNGQVVSVKAYTYHVHLGEQMVYFYDSESKSKTGRNQKTFWQLPDVIGVVAGSALADLPPLVQMQQRIDAVVSRMDSNESAFAIRLENIERSIKEVIERLTIQTAQP